jgi:uncharacterized membrane protein
MASDWIVVVFDSEEQAALARKALKSLENDHRIDMTDAAVLVKDAEGKIKVKNEMDDGVKYGAAGGAFVGLLLAVFFPFVGIAVGALGGAAVGALADQGIDKKFVKEVAAAMTPGTSALFAVFRNAYPGIVSTALAPYKGKIYQTTLDPEAEKALQSALDTRS